MSSFLVSMTNMSPKGARISEGLRREARSRFEESLFSDYEDSDEEDANAGEERTTEVATAAPAGPAATWDSQSETARRSWVNRCPSSVHVADKRLRKIIMEGGAFF